MKIHTRLAYLIFLMTVCASPALCSSEYVTVVKVLKDGDKGIIQRANGEQWLIEKGVGAISFWRYEGKKVIISSPGLFCGVGSSLILPDSDQEARIWNAELLSDDIVNDQVPVPRVAPSVGQSAMPDAGQLRITDLLTADEKLRGGLFKLSASELDALNAALLRALIGLASADTSPTFPAATPSDDEIDLFDSTGAAVAYISLKDDLVVYLWSGKPTAYLDGGSVYGFNGKHLGWYEHRIVYDEDGQVVAAAREVFRSGVRAAPVKGFKQLKPLKSLKSLRPLKPLLSLTWSDTPASVLFILGAR